MDTDDDRKNLYEVTEMQEYRNELYQHQPLPGGKQQQEQGFTTCKLLLIVLVGVLVIILLANVIALGVAAVTLTRINTLSVCNNTQSTSTGSSLTSGPTTDQTMDQQNLPNCSIVYSSWADELAQNNTILQSQVQNLLNTTHNTAWKVDGILNFADEQTSVSQRSSENIDRLLNATGDSARMLIDVVGTLSNLEDTSTSTAGAIDDILLVVDKLLELQNGTTLFNSIRPVSCQDIRNVHPNSPSGYYHVNSRNIYCNMGTLCGSEGGWTRLAYLDMTDATENCPPGFRLYQSGGVRACGRPAGGPSCPSVKYQTNGISYSQVCGRVVGYQYASPDAVDTRFGSLNDHNNLNSWYVDGVSITRGSPRQHVWTLMAGVRDSSYDPGNCPCANPPGATQLLQSFIGTHYFCESGNHANGWTTILYTSDPLWDGQGCGSQETTCCSAPGLPWFHRDYGNVNTTDYIELRVCSDEATTVDDVPVGFYEIYIK